MQTVLTGSLWCSMQIEYSECTCLGLCNCSSCMLLVLMLFTCVEVLLLVGCKRCLTNTTLPTRTFTALLAPGTAPVR